MCEAVELNIMMMHSDILYLFIHFIYLFYFIYLFIYLFFFFYSLEVRHATVNIDGRNGVWSDCVEVLKGNRWWWWWCEGDEVVNR